MVKEKTVYVLEEFEQEPFTEGIWIIRGVVDSENTAKSWHLKNKANRNYYSMVLNEVD